jgi:hypothetical protein
MAKKTGIVTNHTILTFSMVTKKKINKIKLNYNNDKILLSSMVTEKKI